MDDDAGAGAAERTGFRAADIRDDGIGTGCTYSPAADGGSIATEKRLLVGSGAGWSAASERGTTIRISAPVASR